MSRAAFKLQQMDDKYCFIKPGKCIIDLGAAPGGWSQVIAERLFPIEQQQQQGNKQKEGLLVGIDT
jgi:23S rRNA (uridine2552-2'-O)-methyltransferase